MAHVPTQTNEGRGDPGDPRVKPISGKRLCKLLESPGWVLGQIRGSPDVYMHPQAARPRTVPVHGNRDLRAGTQRSIMREAGGTDDDLYPPWPPERKGRARGSYRPTSRRLAADNRGVDSRRPAIVELALAA